MILLLTMVFACSTTVETNYPKSSGPMGIGSGGSAFTPRDTAAPEDTGDAGETGDTGETGSPDALP